MSEATQEKSYDELYQEAAAALEAGQPIPGADAPAEPAEPTTPVEPQQPRDDAGRFAKAEPTEQTPADPPADPDPLDDLRKKYEAQEKALKDTQRWAHELNAKLKRQDDERRRAEFEAAKPPALRDNPELEDAIRYAVAAPQVEQEAQRAQATQSWESIVLGAHPDLTTLQSSDKELWDAAYQAFESLPSKGNDPVEAVRALTEVKLQFAQSRAAAAAEKAAQALAKQQTEKRAMSVPGSGGAVQPAPADPQAEMMRRMQTMSDEDFLKEVNRVMGTAR
ncbi:hypothetical protein CBM2586_B10192 [Cupriavidus phytorum]|uniref:Scaffolding protein n=1 Tax=Cupriavidus taiwanensis TaxID=164546 RepID=A0A975XBQ4_9BURK|nr:hypothetical protein [Cupriavidus taiwanensis]SOY65597.1 hypothetical protein CBM2586_B10192 [Cupriavidus taiwanensis]